MAYCIQNGIDFLGYKTSQCDVLYVDFELRQTSIKNRCQGLISTFNLEKGQNFRVISLADEWGVSESSIEDIIKAVRMEKLKNPNLGLVIFDCYYRFAEGDENAANDTKQTLDKLKPLAKDFTVIYVHHSNKMGVKTGSNAINNGSGSGVHGRIVDQSFVLEAKKDGTIVHNDGRDFYGIKLPCTRNSSGYFIVDEAERQSLNQNQSPQVGSEQLEEQYPELCFAIGNHGRDLRTIKKDFPGETTHSLKEKGFIVDSNKKKVFLPTF